MDANRRKLSGHAYRRKALEKKHKEEKLVKQTLKIDSFFNQNKDEPSTSNVASFGTDLLEVTTAEAVSNLLIFTSVVDCINSILDT